MKEQAMNKRLKASECGFKPIVFVTDESLPLAAMDKKQQAQFGERDSDSRERSVIRYLLILASTNVFSSIDSFAIYDENSAWERKSRYAKMALVRYHNYDIGEL